MRYFIVFLLVFYESTPETDRIKVYVLHTEEKHEIIETLSEGYNEKTKENITYEEIVKHNSKLFYPEYYLDF